MQLLRLLGLALLLLFAAPADARSVVDATGRTVEISDRIERVMPAGPPAAVLLYTLAPEKLIGWPHAPGPAAKSPWGRALPTCRNLRRWYMTEKFKRSRSRPPGRT